jgi:hypothetical protein
LGGLFRQSCIKQMKLQALIFLSGTALFSLGCQESFDVESLPSFQMGEYKNYRVGPYVKAAIRLQEMGQEAACDALLNASHNKSNCRQIFVLCRMLFLKRTTSEFRRPAIGSPVLLGATSTSHWPLEPIECIDGVPFLITQGYVLGGLPESAESYLRYCIANCDWNAARFNVLTDDHTRNALAELIKSNRWKRPLNNAEQDFLSAQIQ